MTFDAAYGAGLQTADDSPRAVELKLALMAPEALKMDPLRGPRPNAKPSALPRALNAVPVS